MTPQEIFDTVVRHLFRQGKQSINSTGDCLYRGPHGTSCAVGCLIPDELYDRNMDNSIGGTGIETIILSYPELPNYFKENLELLAHLQSAHDDFSCWESPETMKIFLREIGRNFELDVSVLDEMKGFGEG